MPLGPCPFLPLYSMGDNLTSSASAAFYIAVDSSATTELLDATQFYAIIFAGTFLSLITIVGNLMVLLSFKMDRELRTISNYFLLSLACADLSIGVISIPFMTYYTATGYWNIGYTLCQVWLCMDYLMSNASVMNLLLISFDRYYSVTKPLTYRPKRTSRKAIMAIFATFFVSALLWPPWIIFWPYIDGEFTAPQGSCYIQFLDTSPSITVITAFGAFYIPVTIMIFLYCRVYHVAQKRRKVFAAMEAHSKLGDHSHRKSLPNMAGVEGVVAVPTPVDKRIAKEKRRTENKAARTLLAIMMAFIITWLPYDIVVIWAIFYPKSTPGWIWSLAYGLCYVNSALNPICYALGNPQYRSTYLKILRCKFTTSTPFRRRSTIEDRI